MRPDPPSPDPPCPDPTGARRGVDGGRVARMLDLEPLSEEGGLFRRTHLDAHSSAIYYLLITPDFSALHALTAAETYHWYAGSALRMLLLGPGETVREPVLGPSIVDGERPQVVVPAGTWQGSSSSDAWTLVGTTTAPPFAWEHFTLGDRAALSSRYPGAADRIRQLTRPVA